MFLTYIIKIKEKKVSIITFIYFSKIVFYHKKKLTLHPKINVSWQRKNNIPKAS